MKDGQKQPGYKPVPIEMAFGDPEALERAAAKMAEFKNCPAERMHCPWYELCRSEMGWVCPLLQERSRTVDKSKDRDPRMGSDQY